MKNTLHIIMADDDEDDRCLMKMAAERSRASYNIEFAANGEELINLLEEKIKLNKDLPDFLLLDLNMPVKDGKTALAEIKQHPQLKQLSIFVFTTALSGSADTTDIIELGAKKIISKPTEFEKLVALTEELYMEIISQQKILKGEEKN